MPSKSEAIERVSSTTEQIPELMNKSSDDPDFLKWKRSTEIMIDNTFPRGSRHAGEFTNIRFRSGVVTFDCPHDAANNARAYNKGLVSAEALLEGMLDEIEEYWEDDNRPQSVIELQGAPVTQVSNRVFVVHGRDDGDKNTVARFLESFGLEAVILHEQPNEGRTIVEKFEDYSDVGFAVIICTPDDVGALAIDRDNLRFRPRQNVVLELGFFLAKLGRQRVCPLVRGNLEMPSDYDGVLYLQMEGSEDWRTNLAIELKNAGLPVDLNRLAKR